MSGTISYGGDPSLSGNNFQLQAFGCPSNQFGVFYYGASQISVPFGNGVRCVGSGGVGTFRLGVIQADAFGDAYQPVDFTQAPFTTGAGQVGSGDERYFQYWFRDPQSSGSSTFDFTDALKVVFCD
jgi:hypothetical protein